MGDFAGDKYDRGGCLHVCALESLRKEERISVTAVLANNSVPFLVKSNHVA